MPGHGGHHGGGHRGGGGWRGYGPVPWGYPVQYGPDVVVVDSSSDDRRVMAYVNSLPAAKRKAAYEQLTGRRAPAGMSGTGTDLLSLGVGAAIPALIIGALYLTFRLTGPSRR